MGSSLSTNRRKLSMTRGGKKFAEQINLFLQPDREVSASGVSWRFHAFGLHNTSSELHFAQFLRNL
jgi:hypothetical protein